MSENRLSTALVAVPVLHVLSTSVYLWSYTLGFGSNLSSFVSPSDLFSTSISVMVRVYITSLIIPFALSVNKYIPGYQPPQVTVTREGAGRFFRITPLVATYFILASIIAIEIYFMYISEPFSFFLLNVAAIVILAPILISIFDNFNLSHLGRDIFYYGILFFVGAFFVGIEAGRTDRHRPYSHYRTGLARCENFAVIRKIDSYYLAILPSSRKALIDDDCKIKIRFPLTKIDR